MPTRKSAGSAIVAGVLALGLGASAAYTVRPGDTLSGIAVRLGVSVGDRARANAIPDPDQVFAGRRLTVPGTSAATPARVHVVVAGDNLSTIARRNGVSVRALASANDLDPDRYLRLGARLVVPATSGAPAGYPARLRRAPARLALVPHFQRWSAANGLPADLLMATTWLESGWQNHVVSGAGAMGIGQLMPGTVRFVREELIGAPWLDPAVPEQNIRMSARFLRFLLDHAGGDVRLALASYYQGPGSVRRNGVYAGTERYVDGVLALRGSFRA